MLTISRICLQAACLGVLIPITLWAIACGGSVFLPSIGAACTALAAFVLCLETVNEMINPCLDE